MDGLPIEVVALFALIPLVGVAGLIKSNGGLSVEAPTVGLGDAREDLTPSAEAAAEADIMSKSQGEQEREYFKILQQEMKEKRVVAGNKATKKKRKK